VLPAVFLIIMAFTLNEKITTILTWEEICLISVACGEYQRLYGEDADKDVLRTMKFLIDRLGREMANHPDNDKPNGH